MCVALRSHLRSRRPQRDAHLTSILSCTRHPAIDGAAYPCLSRRQTCRPTLEYTTPVWYLA